METKPVADLIQDLLLASLRAYNIREDDAVTLKTLKLHLLGEVLQGLGLSWNYVLGIFKTHTPLHPHMAQMLSSHGDEEIAAALAQTFVRNEKLVRIMKALSNNGVSVEATLAIDGLAGNISNGPNFEQKHYIGNLRFPYLGEEKSVFDEEPPYKRLHVQCVREMYKILPKASPKQVYYILKGCFEEMIRSPLPEIDLEMDIEKSDLAKCVSLYNRKMGKENIQKLYKSLRIRGEKRTSSEREIEK